MRPDVVANMAKALVCEHVAMSATTWPTREHNISVQL